MTFQLRNINPEEGFGVLTPFNADFGAGSLTPLGDINGDGLADISISSGTLFVGDNIFLPSREYVIYGTTSQTGPFIDPSALYFRPDLGFVFESVDMFGSGISGVGDVNRDGVDDWTVSVFDEDNGDILLASYIIAGSQVGFPNLSANTVASVADTTVVGSIFLTDIGDVNGDGLNDIAGYISNSIFVIYGKPDGFSPVVDPSSDADLIFTEFPLFYLRISKIGDFNNDGFDDVLINNSGEAVVLFGSADGLAEVSRGANGFATLDDPSRGFVIDATFSSSGIGDVNDDGFDDIAFSAVAGDFDNSDVFVLFGTAEDLGGALSASDIDDDNGVQIILQDDLGLTPSAVGDVNGDAVDDFMIGTAGNGLLLFGGKDAFNDTITINYKDLAPNVGVKFEGFSPGDDRGPGFSGARVGDFNGDGVDDIGVMAPVGGSINTDAFLLYGGPDIGRRPDTEVIVRAGGTGGPEVRPEFSVFINGEFVGSGEIADPQTGAERRAGGTAYDSFVFNAPTFTEEIVTVDIVFANDGRDPVSREDINLFIDNISVGGVTYEAEVSGFFTPDTAGPGRAGPREALWWNGTLTFDLSDGLFG